TWPKRDKHKGTERKTSSASSPQASSITFDPLHKLTKATLRKRAPQALTNARPCLDQVQTWPKRGSPPQAQELQRSTS
ncbi:hypothetical protein PIB30_104808, partial [Stylosanthes scabra]|nr:hypothetical protein [Stylosanthes scabra]